jgi:YhcH/YjgK/YiaL family protein
MKELMLNLQGEQLVTVEMLSLVEKLSKNWVEGRYELSDGAYANAESYMTKEESVFERHEKFIDIQIVMEGMEVIEMITPRVKQEYDANRDIEFIDIPEVKRVYMNAGSHCVIDTDTYHKPCLDCCGKHHVKKVVIKVPKR